jgi:hypothetical protein
VTEPERRAAELRTLLARIERQRQVMERVAVRPRLGRSLHADFERMQAALLEMIKALESAS